MLTAAIGVADRIVRIEEIADGTVLRSTPLTCFECKTQVIAKTGPILAHHFAHLSTAVCSYATGESAEHTSAKLLMVKLLRELAGVGGELRWHSSCPLCSADFVRAIQLTASDEVYAERAVTRRARPDVRVRRRLTNILAVEVLKGNACSPTKRAEYARENVSAPEIRATEILEHHDVQPFVISAEHGAVALPCDACRKAAVVRTSGAAQREASRDDWWREFLPPSSASPPSRSQERIADVVTAGRPRPSAVSVAPHVPVEERRIFAVLVGRSSTRDRILVAIVATLLDGQYIQGEIRDRVRRVARSWPMSGATSFRERAREQFRDWSSETHGTVSWKLADLETAKRVSDAAGLPLEEPPRKRIGDAAFEKSERIRRLLYWQVGDDS